MCTSLYIYTLTLPAFETWTPAKCGFHYKREQTIPGGKKKKKTSAATLASPLLCLFLDFMAFARDVLLDLFEIEMRDLGVVAIDDLGELFECRPFGLDVHEVDEGELEPDPDGVDDVQFPGVVEAERLEGDRVGVLVEQQRDLDRDVEDHEALGA